MAETEIISENQANNVSFHILASLFTSLSLYISGFHLLLCSILASIHAVISKSFQCLFLLKDIFSVTSFHLVFFNFPPYKPSLPSPSFSSTSLSHILFCQGHKLLKEREKKNHMNSMNHSSLSVISSLSILRLPPSLLFRKISKH